jgi:hypothetical protein
MGWFERFRAKKDIPVPARTGESQVGSQEIQPKKDIILDRLKVIAGAKQFYPVLGMIVGKLQRQDITDLLGNYPAIIATLFTRSNFGEISLPALDTLDETIDPSVSRTQLEQLREAAVIAADILRRSKGVYHSGNVRTIPTAGGAFLNDDYFDTLVNVISETIGGAWHDEFKRDMPSQRTEIIQDKHGILSRVDEQLMQSGTPGNYENRFRKAYVSSAISGLPLSEHSMVWKVNCTRLAQSVGDHESLSSYLQHMDQVVEEYLQLLSRGGIFMSIKDANNQREHFLLLCDESNPTALELHNIFTADALFEPLGGNRGLDHSSKTIYFKRPQEMPQRGDADSLKRYNSASAFLKSVSTSLDYYREQLISNGVYTSQQIDKIMNMLMSSSATCDVCIVLPGAIASFDDNQVFPDETTRRNQELTYVGEYYMDRLLRYSDETMLPIRQLHDNPLLMTDSGPMEMTVLREIRQPYVNRDSRSLRRYTRNEVSPELQLMVYQLFAAVMKDVKMVYSGNVQKK